MQIPTLGEARSELRILEPRLEECVRQGWSEYKSVMAERHPGMRVRCRRTLLQEFIVKEVEAAFGLVPGLSIIETRSGRVLLVVADAFVLQVKHLTREFRTKNIPTDEAVAFNAQRLLPGYPPLPRLTLGFRLDALEASIEGVYVLCGLNNRPVWYYRIDDNGEGIWGAETIEMLPPDAPTAPPSPRIRPKIRRGGEEAAPERGTGTK